LAGWLVGWLAGWLAGWLFVARWSVVRFGFASTAPYAG